MKIVASADAVAANARRAAARRAKARAKGAKRSAALRAEADKAGEVASPLGAAAAAATSGAASSSSAAVGGGAAAAEATEPPPPTATLATSAATSDKSTDGGGLRNRRVASSATAPTGMSQSQKSNPATKIAEMRSARQAAAAEAVAARRPHRLALAMLMQPPRSLLLAAGAALVGVGCSAPCQQWRAAVADPDDSSVAELEGVAGYAETIVRLPILLSFVVVLAFMQDRRGAEEPAAAGAGASSQAMMASMATGASQQQMQRLIDGGSSVFGVLQNVRAIMDDVVGVFPACVAVCCPGVRRPLARDTNHRLCACRPRISRALLVWTSQTLCMGFSRFFWICNRVAVRCNKMVASVDKINGHWRHFSVPEAGTHQLIFG
jgi:hypothetical protein